MDDIFRLDDRVAIITGAGQGIGAAIARAFAGAGARVVLAGRRREPLDAVAAALPDPTMGLVIACDVADERQVADLAGQAERRFGRVDVLVNNAGVLGEGRLDALTEADWDEVIAINLRGAMHCTRAVFPGMRERRHGVVVNIASISGQTGGLSANVPYAASKGGMLALTKATARQMAPWGRANAVAPGQIDTSMGTRNPAQVRFVEEQVPLQRLGTPAEVAACALFLASPASSYVNGHVLNVNGGFLMD